MNLRKILNYKNNCIICNHDLTLYANLKANDFLNEFPVKITERSIIIQYYFDTLELNFDGTISYTEYFTKYKKLSLIKLCPVCNRNQGFPKHFDQSSLIELMYATDAYRVEIKLKYNSGTFTCIKDSELVSFINTNSMYCIETSFKDKISLIKTGETISTLFYARLPAISTKGLNRESFIAKIKMLIAFS